MTGYDHLDISKTVQLESRHPQITLHIMVGNKGKFIDRSPHILAAGRLINDFDESVGNCLLQGSTDDAVSVLKDAAGIKKEEFTYKLAPWNTAERRGIYTEIQPVLQPGVETRYQTLINELKETSYDSHWNKILGKSRDPVAGLPKGLNPLETTFGNPTIRKVTMKDLINPPKTTYQVLSESQIGHEMYRKSHNDFNPGERVNRNYLEPAYDRDKRYGERSKYDARGIWARCCLQWFQNEPVIYTNKKHADYNNTYKSKLGEALTPNNIKDRLPEGTTFGTPCERNFYGMEDLLKDSNCSPCVFKRDFKKWMASFNKLRLHLKQRFQRGLCLKDVYKKFLYYDRDRSGILQLETFLAVCKCEGIYLDLSALESLFRALLVILDEDKVDYRKFLEVVDWREPPIELAKIEDIPERNKYYVTTNQAAACDYLIVNNAESPAAGIPTIRSDLERPTVPFGSCRADLENLGENTYSGNLLNPNIYSNYGLSFRDFFLPRPKEIIRSLFEKIGYKMEDDAFEKLWNIGVNEDGSGLVCVDTFFKLVKKHYPDEKKLVIDEATC